jgi:poly [ADP-ribose] polymerase
MPLGKLSKTNIARGYEILEVSGLNLLFPTLTLPKTPFPKTKKLKEAVQGSGSAATLQSLSSQFFTLIPHSFGRQRPPTLDSLAAVQDKMDLLATLADIEIAMSVSKEAGEKSDDKHPDDLHYEGLKCTITPLKKVGCSEGGCNLASRDLPLVPQTAPEYKVIEQYLASTSSGYGKLQEIFTIDREGEAQRFARHDKIENRRLLWWVGG